MKHLSFFFILLILLPGLSCILPERTHSILPPTSEKSLCQDHENFYYSSIFDFCFEYSSDKWHNVQASLPKSIPGSSLTSIDYFFQKEDGNKEFLMTLYITGFGRDFENETITTTYNQSPYLIGYRSADPTESNSSIASLLDEIPQIMQTIKVFTTR